MWILGPERDQELGISYLIHSLNPILPIVYLSIF